MSPYERQHQLALELMRERGLGGLVVYSDATCNILRASYLRYVAGFAPLGPHAAAVVSVTGHTAILVTPTWDARRVTRQSWIDDVSGTDEFADALPQLLRRLGIGGKVGLAGGRDMPSPVFDALAGVADLHACDDLIEQVALQKSAAELATVRRAAAVADAGFEAFRRFSRAGIREFELVAEVEYVMRIAGADDIFILISTGPHNRAMRAPTDRRVEQGDVIIGEISPVCDGQFVQLCRTVSVGQPTEALVRSYDVLLDAYRSAVAQVRSGVPASVIATAIDEVLSSAGYAEYCRPPYMRTRGHGFGVGSVAPGPVIDVDTHTLLHDDQIIVVHPNQYLPETGYLACGETIRVTAAGPEALATSETRLWVSEA